MREGTRSPAVCVCVSVCVSGAVLGKMVSDNGSCLCLSCDAEVMLLDQRGVRASLAPASQQNNKHASQANSSCHVVNGLRYTSWRPAEAFDLRGGITNTPVLGVWAGGWGWVRDKRRVAEIFLSALAICQRTHWNVDGGELLGGSWESGSPHQCALMDCKCAIKGAVRGASVF